MEDDIDLIASSVELPNGGVVPNRLVKVAMEEGIGNGGGLPTRNHLRLYRRWAQGGWGIIIAGNVQVDHRHLATAHDRIIPDSTPETIGSYSQLNTTIRNSVPLSSPQPLTLIQLSHAGLQSSSTINFSRAPWARAVAPCSARPDMGDSIMGWIIGRFIWPGKSRTIIDPDEWLQIVDRFVEAACVAEKAGWGGVQLHSAHGYLLAEYLSPLTNPSPMSLPGVPSQIPLRLHLLYLILTGICEKTETKFVKSVKMNCSDFVHGGLDEKQSAEIVKELVSWRMIDILEISGGNYSSPAFANLDSISTSRVSRQCLFAHFTTFILPDLPPPPQGPAIILTGGLHDRTLIASSLRGRACDLAGIGRPACVRPTLPRDIILNREIQAEDTALGGYQMRGAETMKWLLSGMVSTTKKDLNQPAAASYAETETQALLSDNVAQKSSGIPLVGAGVSTSWHEWQLCRIGRGKEPDMLLDWVWGGFIVEGLWFGLLKGGPWGWWKEWRE